ncbi:helix-turn-helix domain-containing protein [Chromobacterium paludis]|uniref:Helix-turn-helix transcriptional regulator n=1 Tax=Chromobacterium paludis TaxID=2605945 RepID=A0A5C1DFH4_9NEIS|nr:helix-turn-helix transcriptional regulator [Chromobacterium paludis]
MSDETIHSRLRAAIKARGITVTAVAAHLQVSRSTVNRWLKYQIPDDEQIFRLSAYLNVSPSHLRRGSDMNAEHMMLCQILFAKSTDISSSDVQRLIDLADRFSDTDLCQTE